MMEEARCFETSHLCLAT